MLIDIVASGGGLDGLSWWGDEMVVSGFGFFLLRKSDLELDKRDAPSLDY